MRESRRLQRTRFTAEQHFDALDADADEVEASLIRHKEEMTTAVNSLRADIKGVQATLIGLLMAVMLALLGLAGNLILHAV